MHFPPNTDDFSRNPGIYNARGGTRSRDEGLQGGLYGQRQGMTQKVAKLQDEDDDDDESDIISGKFSPCGGDCDKGNSIMFIKKYLQSGASSFGSSPSEHLHNLHIFNAFKENFVFKIKKRQQQSL